jgi:lipoate---protein ligase
MLYADNQQITDPRLNLALEEYLLRHVAVDEAILLFYVNTPSVIVGRNQNIWEEIDPDYVAAREVQVVRRLSGGGAVYHDLGNLNYSFITNGSRDLHNFHRFTGPVIAVLNGLGVPAEAHGKSDIYVAGRKISGNAQYLARNRMVSHGTILFDSDLEALLHALNPRQVVIESSAVQSIRARVTNVREWLPDWEIDELRAALLAGIFAPEPVRKLELTAVDWSHIQQIRAERYLDWEWTYGRSPRFIVEKRPFGPDGLCVQITVDKGRVAGLSLSGEGAVWAEETAVLHSLLQNVRYEPIALAEALDGLPTTIGLMVDEVLAWLF